jgi:hypothetical protein
MIVHVAIQTDSKERLIVVEKQFEESYSVHVQSVEQGRCSVLRQGVCRTSPTL